MWMRLRGSSNTFCTRGAKPRAASTMAGSISMVSSSRTPSCDSSTSAVRPEPKPTLATVAASGFISSGIAASSVMVHSSELGRWKGSICTPASGLPLVVMATMAP